MRRNYQLCSVVILLVSLAGCNTHSIKTTSNECSYLPETPRPQWTTETHLPGYYVGIGIAEFKLGEKAQRQSAYDDAVSNLAKSITSTVISSTSSSIKEVNGQVDSRASIVSEVASQLKIDSIENDVWWLDRNTCQLWTRTKIDKSKGDALRNEQKRDRMDSVEIVLWSQIKESGDIRDFRMYLSAFERGQFADIAKEKLQKLESVPTSTEQRATSRIDPNFIEKAQILAAEDRKDWQIVLAHIYANGDGAKQNLKKAEYWLRRAVELGSIRAEYDLGILLKKMNRLDESMNLLKERFDFSFTDYDSEDAKIEAWILYHLSSIALGDIHYFDLEDDAAAYQYYSSSYQNDTDFVDEYQTYMLGFLHYHGQGVTKNEDEAIRLLEKSASTNYTPALLKLGKIYSERMLKTHDEQFRENKTKAVNWFNKAIDVGSAEAKSELFDLYFQIFETSKALSLVIEDAERGNLDAQYQVCRLYIHKIKKTSAIEKWCHVAAESGHAQSQLELAKFYMDRAQWRHISEYNEALEYKEHYWTNDWWSKSKGKPQKDDRKNALVWAKRAASSGLADAQYYLCKQYYSRNEKELGLAWCERASAQGNSGAKRFLKSPYNAFTSPLDRPIEMPLQNLW